MEQYVRLLKLEIFQKKPKGMSEEYYRKFTQQCFNFTLFVDRTSISTTAISYLFDKLGFFGFSRG